MSERDFDDFYFPLTEEKLEKAKEEEEEKEMGTEFEERGKMEMKEIVEDALAPGLEPATSELKVACANHKAAPLETDP